MMRMKQLKGQVRGRAKNRGNSARIKSGGGSGSEPRIGHELKEEEAELEEKEDEQHDQGRKITSEVADSDDGAVRDRSDDRPQTSERVVLCPHKASRT